MKIFAINSIKNTNIQQNKHISNNITEQKQNISNNNTYNPVYYRDYNVQVSFGKRSPEDFYSQDFNRDNMPETMKQYLNAKFEERSKIAPVQIMQEAFDDLNLANSAEEIKRLFPNENKFSKLRNANSTNATHGILKKIKDIKSMQDVPEPLFKDGCDDLTTYLVKKIYLEGKTAKEIDKDFAKDINEVYELAARIPDETAKTLGKNESAYFSHSTIYNLGIRFPEVPFWNSFIATRDDYERTKRVKSLSGEFVNADSAEGRKAILHRQTKQSPKVEPNKYNFKREKLKNITDTIVNSNGDSQKALKEIKRRGKNIEELTFLQKYWSQIMTLATDKIHLSEEMIAFNDARKETQDKISSDAIDKLINGSEFTKREKTPFAVFWSQRAELKSEFSNAITDVIMQFTDAYGADGNNDYFKNLLKDIENIKPNREQARLLHEQRQAEYDELAKSLMPKVNEEQPTAKTIVEEFKETLKETNQEPESFKYIINGHEVTTPFDIKLHAYQAYKNNLTMIPNKMVQTYLGELEKLIPNEDKERFYLSACFEKSPETPDINKALFSDEELFKINDNLITIMETKHNPHIEATRIALLEYADKKGLLTPEVAKEFAAEDIMRIRDVIYEHILKTGEVDSASKEINDNFNTLFTPLTNKEKNKIKIDLFQYLKTYDMKETLTPKTSTPNMIKLLSIGVNEEPTFAQAIKIMLSSDKMFDFEGPVLKYILKPDGNNLLKTILKEHAIKNIVYLFPGDTSYIMAHNPKKFSELMASFPTEFEVIYQLSKKIIAHTALKLK